MKADRWLYLAVPSQVWSSILFTLFFLLFFIFISLFQIIPDDGLPDKVCSACVRKLDDCSDFVKQCESSDLYLRGIIAKNVNKQINIITIKKDSDTKDDLDEVTDIFDDVSAETSVLHDIVPKTENTAKPDLHIKSRKSRKAQKEQCSTCGKVLSSK